MDKIILTDLRINAVIGIWDWERRNPQTISIDLEMQTDTKKASQSDSIEDALDYKAVSKRVKQFIQESQFNLIETAAENVAKIILSTIITMNVLDRYYQLTILASLRFDN